MTRPQDRAVQQLHQADRIVLALLSTAVLAIALLLALEAWAGRLNPPETQAVQVAAVALGLVQVWLSARLVLAITLWAASPAPFAGPLPWALPLWWLGAIPTGWLGLVFPGREHHPGFLGLCLVMILVSAGAMLGEAQAVERPRLRAGLPDRGR